MSGTSVTGRNNMDRWIGKVAVVTGASAGIGAAIAVDLVNAGVIVVGLARRQHRVDELRSQISHSTKGALHSLKCDVSIEADIQDAFAWVDAKLGGVDILVNNAGILRTTNLVDVGNTQAIKDVLDTNVLGVVLCTREAFQSMKRRNVSGHVVIINSVSGHNVPYFSGTRNSMNIYQPSKHAITAMTEVLRQEFQTQGTQIKITSISPGVVRTEIFTPDMAEFLKDPMLNASDVSAAVMYALGTPPHVQVHELTIKPIGERFL